MKVCVRAQSILESVRDVRARGPFLSVRCAIALLHTFWDKIARKCYVLEHFKNILKTVAIHTLPP